MAYRASPAGLIVESQPTVARIVEYVTRKAGFQQVVSVPTCASAIEWCDNRDIAFVLVDSMDRKIDMKGYESIKVVMRELDRPTGLMTTSIERSLPEMARDRICDFVVLKPFSVEGLRLKLQVCGVPLPSLPDLEAPKRRKEDGRENRSLFPI